MAQNFMVRCRGLYTLPNELSEVPAGSLTTADNVVIDKDGIVNPRRGFATYGTSAGSSASTVIKQLMNYKTRVLRHWGTTVDYDSDGAGTFSVLGTSITEQSTGSRIKYAESNGNLYFTSSQGIKKISANSVANLSSASVTSAGGIKALDGYADLNSQEGWFTQDSTVAYRIVWGIKDANTNVILGDPSSRIVIANPMLSLLISDINNLLNNLTTVAQNNTGGSFQDQTLGSLRLSVNADPVEVYGLLLELANVSSNILDTDLSLSGISVTTTLGSPTATVASSQNIVAGMKISGNSNIPSNTTVLRVLNDGVTLTLSNNATNIVTTQIVTTSASSTTATMSSTAGLSNGMTVSGNPSIPSGTTITVVNSTTITLSNPATTSSSTSTDFASTTASASTGFLNTTFQDITPPTLPQNPATTAQLLSIQAYYDSIIDALNGHPGITASAKSHISGGFLNSTQDNTVDLTFYVPQGVTTAHFYQVYRSALFSSSGATTLSEITPDDELFLIQEDNPTSGQISAGVLTWHDIVPEVFRENGTPLYTNENSGQGIAQSNDIPPLAQDIALYSNALFYANTQSNQYIQFNLLTAIGLAGNTLTLTQGANSLTFTFVPTASQVTNINVIPGSSFTSTGTADYFDIYSAENTVIYRVWFNVGSVTAPSSAGVTLVECTISNSDSVTQVATKLKNTLLGIADFISSQTFTGTLNINSNIIQNIQDTSFLRSGMGISGTGIPNGTTITAVNPTTVVMSNNATQDGPSITVTLTSNVIVTNENVGASNSPANHVANGGFTLTVLTQGSTENAAAKQIGVSNASTAAQEVDETARSLVRIINGQSNSPVNAYYMSGATDIPGIIRFEGRVLGAAPTYLTCSAPISGAFNPSLPSSGTSVGTSTDINSNRLFWSKVQQPEAVPLVNYSDVGPRDKAILRILPLRDSLFILSQDGIYQLTGSDPTNFSIVLFDNTTKIIAPDTACVLNNQVYFLSDQGVVCVSSTGVSVISRPIEDQIFPVTEFANFVSASFAVGYSTDRAYMLWTVTNNSDSYATQCFRYHTFTQTWVRWPIAKNCGVVVPETAQLFLGPADVNYVENERKTFSRLDYADRQYTLDVIAAGIQATNLVTMQNIGNAENGDSLVQTQYLTVSQWNRFLKKLDNDNSLTFKQYTATYSAYPGNDLYSLLLACAQRLDTDHTSGGYGALVQGYSNTLPNQQSAYNAVVNALNLDSRVSQHNYPLSSGTVQWEVPIVNINTVNNTFTLAYLMPLIAGEIILFKQISSTITWAPQHFGDPSMTKHIREATVMFQDMSFNNASALYGTDLRPGYIGVPITGEGTGVWGSFNWGQVQFGGQGSSRPFRTLVPQDKQRCRYIVPEFQHSAAFENFAVYGISFTYEMTSSRGYR